MSSARERLLEFRRSLPRTPPLHRHVVRARGLSFATWSSPPVAGAEPLVCINGGMLYGHAMLWPSLAPLAHTRQVILYDQRGRGESEAPPDVAAAAIDDDALDVGAIRRALGIRRWDVLGHSWGGAIALLGAAADPGGTRRVVTVDAVGPDSTWMAPLRERTLARLEGAARDAYAAIPDERLAEPDPEVHAALSRAQYPAWFADRDMARHFAPPTGTSPTGAAVLARLRREGYDWRDRVRALSVPVLVLHGDEDTLPAAVADQWAAVLPGAVRVVVGNAGHMPFWEAPQRFFESVESFLSARFRPHPSGTTPFPP